MRRRLTIAATLALALPGSFLVGSAPAEAASATTRGDCVVKQSVRTCVTLHRGTGGNYFATAEVRNLDGRSPLLRMSVTASVDSAPCSTGRWTLRRTAQHATDGPVSSTRTGTVDGAARTLYRARVESLWTYGSSTAPLFSGDSTRTALLGSC